MAKIIITINTDNAAFEDEPGKEIERILKKYAYPIGDDYYDRDTKSIKLRDINGNTCGTVVFDRD